MTARKATEPKATERELLALLERKHAKQGNGGSGEYAYLTHVRNDGGFSANRTFDAVTVSLWPSRGYEIHVYEVKVSRSDWMRELKDPKKSDDAWAIGDRFSVVATAGVVDPAELPTGWGLIEAHGAKIVDGVLTGRKLRTVRPAEYHGPTSKSQERTVSRGLLVSMLRRAGAVPDHETPSDKIIRQAIEKAVAEREEVWRAARDRAQEELREIQAAVRVFTNASGVHIRPSYGGSLTLAEVEQNGRRVRAALADDHYQDKVTSRLKALRQQLADQVAVLDRAIENPQEGRS